MKDKEKPDVLRLTEYVLDKNKKNEAFSVQSAALSKELNGIGRHQIARIMKDICLDPDEEGSLKRVTTVDSDNIDNTYCHWQLNASSYFSYLSYLSVKNSERSNQLSVTAVSLAIVSLCITVAGLSVWKSLFV